MHIRAGRPGDGPATRAVFHDAVHRGAAGFYTPEERHAWAPPGPVPADWEERLLTGICLVAEAPRGTAVGFATLSADGYLDFLYVAPDWMGRGVAGALYDPLEMQARAFGVTALSTEASHLARRFLERRGWRVEARQSVIRHGVPITNFRMEKQLSA